MNKGKPFFGGAQVDFLEAFPAVEKLELVIEREQRRIDGPGWDWSTHKFTEENVQPHISCSSLPACHRGGYNIESLLRSLESKRQPGEKVVLLENQFLYCQGDFGSLQGRHKGKPCSIQFNLKIAKMTFK